MSKPESIRENALNAVHTAFNNRKCMIAVFTPDDKGGVTLERHTINFPVTLFNSSMEVLFKNLREEFERLNEQN